MNLLGLLFTYTQTYLLFLLDSYHDHDQTQLVCDRMFVLVLVICMGA